MTNAVPVAYDLGVPIAMSTRSSTIAPHSSYASVLSGQARLSQISPELLHTSPSTPYRSSVGFAGPAHQALTHVPSYLADSLYAERLASRGLNPSSATSPISPSSPKRARGHIHRGASAEIVECAPAIENSPAPLPSRWNDNDKSGSIELFNNGCEVRFTGLGKSTESDIAASVRADRPMPPQCGLFYYETTIISKGKEGLIGIGFCTEKAVLNKLPGWEQESWGYHGDDGNSFCCGPPGRKPYGPTFTTGDIIGCGVNFRTHEAFFTKNGRYLEVAFRDINKGKLFPVVGMKKAGEHVKVNFGREGFVFDIDHYMKMEKARTYDEINRHPITHLCPPLDETALIQALVSQYLAHDGYVDTARAFADDVRNEARALDSDHDQPGLNLLDSKGDAEAVNRQRIRSALLEGDVEKALKLTNHFYPDVLKDNESLRFRLRRRRLIEMIRGVAEKVRDESGNMKNGYKERSTSDDYDHDMDVDDEVYGGLECRWEEGMDVDEVDMVGKIPAHVDDALDGVVKYARQLRVQFNADHRPDIKKSLDEVFSLIAYTDPKESIMAHLLDENQRVADAEELNSAILVSLGKSSVAALERLVKQSTVLIQEISEDGGPGAFINLRNDFLKDPGVITS